MLCLCIKSLTSLLYHKFKSGPAEIVNSLHARSVFFFFLLINLIFFAISYLFEMIFSKKNLQKYHRSGNQFGTSSGLRYQQCANWLGPRSGPTNCPIDLVPDLEIKPNNLSHLIWVQTVLQQVTICVLA